MRFVYADPPYLGQAKRRYSHDKKCSEVNHPILIEHLESFDAWALSLSSPSLKTILPMCNEERRVGGWFKNFCSFKPNVNPAYCWEPVIFKVGPRKRTREERTVRDYVCCPITLEEGLAGAKPESFCFWIFELLGATPEDELTDLFTGTNNVSKAWEKWKRIKLLNPRIDVGHYTPELFDPTYRTYDRRPQPNTQTILRLNSA